VFEVKVLLVYNHFIHSIYIRPDSCQNADQSTHPVLCLQGLCRLASAALGQTCIIDSTAYLGYNETGHQVIATVTRDDCQVGLYCDETTLQCTEEKTVGSSCVDNRECIDFNCNADLKICQVAPQSVHKVPAWSWGLIALLILIGLLSSVFSLHQLHLRHRVDRSEEIDQFFSEQWNYRNSILSMHSAAAMASSHRDSHLSFRSQSQREGQDGDNPFIERATREKCQDDDDEDHSWTSSLDIKASPTSSLSHPTASPRFVHRHTPSP
jgi:hypothetical protein